MSAEYPFNSQKRVFVLFSLAALAAGSNASAGSGSISGWAGAVRLILPRMQAQAPQNPDPQWLALERVLGRTLLILSRDQDKGLSSMEFVPYLPDPERPEVFLEKPHSEQIDLLKEAVSRASVALEREAEERSARVKAGQARPEDLRRLAQIKERDSYLSPKSQALLAMIARVGASWEKGVGPEEEAEVPAQETGLALGAADSQAARQQISEAALPRDIARSAARQQISEAALPRLMARSAARANTLRLSQAADSPPGPKGPVPAPESPAAPHAAPASEFRPRSLAAMVIGGLLLSASFPYVVLKIGMALPLSMVAALLAHLVIAGLFRRKDFSARENNLIQTAATSAASTGFMVVVLAALDLMGFALPPLMVFLWLTISSSLGILMAVPVRRHFIEVESLPFPSGAATAEVLKTLEDPKGEGQRKARALAVSGTLAFAFTCLRDVFSLIPAALVSKRYALGLEPSLLLVGSGMILGLRGVAWMLVGSLLTWGALAPFLVSQGIGLETARAFRLEALFDQGQYYPVLMRWTMWPATILMAAHGVTTLLAHWRKVKESLKAFAAAAREPEAPSELSFKTVLGGILGLTAALGLVQYLWLGVNPWLTLLAVALSFVLMLVGIRALGETNLGPISVLGNLSQVAFGVVSPGNIAVNMAASGSTGSIANSSQDLMLDMKTAHLLGNTPKSMTLAQLLGVPLGALMVTIVYPILRTVYGFGQGGLPAPTAHKWKGFAELLTQGVWALPPSAAVAMAAAGVAGVALALMEKRWPKSQWVPSAMGLGLAMLLPATTLLPMALGGALAWAIARLRSGSPGWLIPAAAGLIAGEAFAILVISVLRSVGAL